MANLRAGLLVAVVSSANVVTGHDDVEPEHQKNVEHNNIKGETVDESVSLSHRAAISDGGSESQSDMAHQTASVLRGPASHIDSTAAESSKTHLNTDQKKLLFAQGVASKDDHAEPDSDQSGAAQRHGDGESPESRGVKWFSPEFGMGYRRRTNMVRTVGI